MRFKEWKEVSYAPIKTNGPGERMVEKEGH